MMFLALFLIGFRRQENLQGTKLANDKTISTFSVLGSSIIYWDFADLQANSKAFTYTDKNFTYYVRFAKELQQSDLPSWADFTAISDHKGTNAVRCHNTQQKCQILSTIYEYDWNTILDQSPETGCLYIADGEPYYNNIVDPHQWEEFEVHFEFRCNKTTTSWEPQIFVDTPYSHMPRLYLLFKNSQSCGAQGTKKPENTPGPFNPDCTVYYRDDQAKEWAIYFNLSEWNGGALGIPLKLNTGTDTKYVFWQPCERMVNCPWGARCDGDKLSSAWLCDSQIKNCENFTVIPYGDVNNSYVDTNLFDDSDLNKGFEIVYRHVPERTLKVNVTCKHDYPNDHVFFKPTATYDQEHKILTFAGETLDACPRNVPEPVPPVDKCKFNLTQGNYFIDFDMAALPRKSKSVNVRGDVVGEYDLFYHPCDSMPCPVDYDCDGDEDGTVYLCEKYNFGGTKLCTAYGILDHGVSASLKGDYIINGATIYYSGDRKRKAEVDFKCNKSVLSHDYILPDSIFLRNGLLSIDVDSIEACMAGSGPTPSPPPVVQPTIPEKIDPTPSPVPSPKAVYFFEDSAKGEYVLIDLTKIAASKPFKDNMQLITKGKKGSVYTEFHPWNLLPYPTSWGTNPAFDYANFWQCWFDNKFQPYCHPIGDKRVPGLNVSLQKSNDISSGVRITYEGAYGVNLDIDINCDQSVADQRVDLAKLVVVYSQSTANDKWTIDTDLELSCPNKYLPGTTPSPTITPSPPAVTPMTHFSTQINGEKLELNLDIVKSTTATIALGYSDRYSKYDFHYSATEKIGCPSGKTCPSEYNEGNVFMCPNATFCFPVGNMDYGLTIAQLGKTDYFAGLTANYDGGWRGSEVHINYFCKEGLPIDQIQFENIGILNPPGNVPVLHAFSSQVCPGSVVPDLLRKTTGGAYFLIALAVVFIAYFGIGTMTMYVWSGQISIPNEPFWTEFYQCVITAVVFICTFGKSQTSAAYDNI